MNDWLPLSNFKNKHENENILVLGLGESINLLPETYDGVSIGCNDIGRKFTPTYLLNVNNRSQYKGDRFSFIENSKARFLFTQEPSQQPNPLPCPLVKFDLGYRGGYAVLENSKIPYTQNTPYMGVALAAYMGAKRIGLLGVDIVGGHFWVNDGPHNYLQSTIEPINLEYERIAAHLRTNGVELVNLSPISAVESLKKESLAQWITETLFTSLECRV